MPVLLGPVVCNPPVQDSGGREHQDNDQLHDAIRSVGALHLVRPHQDNVALGRVDPVVPKNGEMGQRHRCGA